jgi:predicted RNase H-like HicB family nuclease
MTTYDVLVTRETDNRYIARVLALPNVSAIGESESEALEHLRTAITEIQSRSHIVQLEIPSTGVEDNPWLRFAGMWKHDPSWEEFQAEVEAYRKEIDAKFAPDQ